jgi:glycerol-3-phosphate dehydrogenase (NAD(P)+)
MKIAVLGSGAWGTALAKLLADKGNEVLLFGQDARCESINTKHINEVFYPDVLLPENLTFTTDLGKAIAGKELLLFSVPSAAYREVAKKVSALVSQKVHIVSTAKGFDPSSFERLSAVLREEIPEALRYPIVTLIGPSYATEVIHGKLTCVTAISQSEEEARFIQKTFSGPLFRVYTNTDEVGAECSSALKNVIAIAAGIVAGLGQGENAKAALVTRGIAEMIRFGEASGGKKETYFGLTGIGDLMLTCNSMQSRNFSLGFAIGQADDAKSVLASNTKTVEGINTSKFAYELSRQYGIEMPITEAVYRILFENVSPSKTVKTLMQRSLKKE